MAKNTFIRSGAGLKGGVYKCAECGKATRETGEGESVVGICLACWELAGIENAHNDGICARVVVDCPFCKEETTAEKEEIKPVVHLCLQCNKDLGNEWILGAVCGKCCRKNHRKAGGR